MSKYSSCFSLQGQNQLTQKIWLDTCVQEKQTWIKQLKLVNCEMNDDQSSMVQWLSGLSKYSVFNVNKKLQNGWSLISMLSFSGFRFAQFDFDQKVKTCLS